MTGDPAPVSLRENLRRWLEAPLDGIVLFGSTGEGVLLDEDERVRLLDFAREVVPDELPLVAGAGGESTRQTVRMANRFADAGADALLVHPPVYFGSALSAGQIRDHYRAVADASPAPIMLYHMPKYTGVTLEAGLIGELAAHDNITALKDSSGDLKRLGEFIDACGEDCRVFVGNGALLYSALELGAAGGVVAAGLLAPDRYTHLLACFRAGRHRDAGAVQETLAPVHREIVGRYGVPGVKAALERLGYHGGPLRPPLRGLSERPRRHVARVLQDAKLT